VEALVNMIEPRQIVTASEVKARQIVTNKPNPVQFKIPQGSSTAVGASQALGTASMRTLLSNAPKPKQPTFVDKQKENIQALRTGEVKPMDVVKEVPRAVVKVGAKTGGFIANTLVPAVKNFTKKTGSIIGEGLAYALDPNVRKEYESGRTDILPTITETTQKDIVKSTVGAGLEMAVYNYFPDVARKAIVARGGIGALEGIGFAVSTGLAEDKTPEEIIKSLPAYGVTGAVAGLASPYLLPILKAEVGKVTPEVKNLFKGIYSEVKGKPPVKPTTPKISEKTSEEIEDEAVQRAIYGKREDIPVDSIQQKVNRDSVLDYNKKGVYTRLDENLSKEFQNELKSIPDEDFQKDILHVTQIERVTQNPNVPYREVSIDELRKMSPTANKAFERIEARKKTTPKTVEVPSEQLPVGSGETKVSRLEARAKGIKDDINKLTEAEAEELGLSTYQKSDQEKNIATGLKYFEGKEDEAIAILNGQKTMPKEVNIETNALLIGMIRKAEAEGNTALIQKLATSTRVRSLASTRAGQEISILQKLDPDGVISKIAEVENVRIKAFERKSGTTVSETKKNLSKKAREQVDLTKLKLKEVNSLLDSITC